MNRTAIRSGLAFTAAVAGLYAGTAVLPVADAATASAPHHRTTLTFEVPDCEGCELSLVQARWTDSKKHPVRVWDGPRAVVDDGTATFTVRSRHTWGMSVQVDAPWDGQLAAVTSVAFRYAGHGVGDEVAFTDARHARRASACWEGTRRDEVTIPLTVRKVRVDGVRGSVDGSIAYATTTESWLQPMRRAYRGVLASQDVNVCGPRG
ncbi:hypothetical protein [Nocardioides sp. YIM 152315]|uniref:hypothetical protein n=1 Tax=Nocardioides sp. YIM 152315 TaxID=3031760 RepID=UPI0023D9C1E4|nr:hypothetical protein [Nocardioides sp. YIM 152315]MDF1606267.1 hypothetical protein [Nocardioides sp. YIM 152315]